MKMYTFIVVMFMMVVLFAQNPPRELVAEAFDDPRIDLVWMTPAIPLDIYEIAYEDGSGGGADAAEAGDMLSVRFTPTERCSLIATKFYGYTMYPDIVVRINVYPDNGYGKPDIFSPMLATPINWEISTGWQEVDISYAGLVFDAYEDFHIGITKISPVDTFPHYIFVDTDSTTEERSWWYDYSMFGFHPIAGNLEIRALVTYSPGLARKTLSEKFVMPAMIDEIPTEVPMTYFISPGEVLQYQVYRGTLPDTLGMVPLTSTADTFLTDSSVDFDITYYYAVKAIYDGDSISGFSNMASATPRSSTATTYLDTIIVDDNVHEASATWSLDHGFGTLLTPPGVGRVRSLLFYFTNIGEFRPEIWSVDTAGSPKKLRDAPLSFLSASTSGWRSVTWSTWTTTVVDEPFVAACICGYSPISIGMDIPGFSSSFDFNSATWSAMPGTTYMIRAIVEYNTDEAYYNIHQGWNLVGLPIALDNDSTASLFPFAVGGVAYSYNTETRSYEFAYTIEPGKGYWILSLVDTSFVISGGTPINSMDVDVVSGLNMISGTAEPHGYSVYDIYDYPDGIIMPEYLYTYDFQRKQYIATDRLLPGKGYFLLSFGSGIVRFE